MSAAVLSWQDIAQTIAHNGEKHPLRTARPQRGNRRIPQETVRAIRADVEAGVPRHTVREKYHVSLQFIYNVVDLGLRDDEREVFR